MWACERFAHYIQGMGCVHLQTDHKPLVPLINTYDLDKATLRCQRLLTRLMQFNVSAKHVPGKQLVVADMLSRLPLNGDGQSDTDGQVKAYVNAVVASKPIKSPKLEEICRATQSDAELQKVIPFNRKGWPQRIEFFTTARISRSQGLPFRIRWSSAVSRSYRDPHRT